MHEVIPFGGWGNSAAMDVMISFSRKGWSSDCHTQWFCDLQKLAGLRIDGSKGTHVWYSFCTSYGTFQRPFSTTSCLCSKHEDYKPNNSTKVAVDFPQLSSEKEEAKAIVLQFLRSLGLSNTLSKRVVKKGVKFINHLLSVLHTRYHIRYTTGRELTTAEIQGTLLPYLETLAQEHGDRLVDILIYFPEPPPSRRQSNAKSISSKKLPVTRRSTGSRVLTLNGIENEDLTPSLSYALSLGLSIQQVELVLKKYPSFSSFNPEIEIKPVVNYFFDLGVTRPGIAKIFMKRPMIFGYHLEEKLKPTVLYVESLGVQKSEWPRILVQFPALLTYGKDKLQEAVNFLLRAGLSSEEVGTTISRFPHVVSYSVEDKLIPTLEFLKRFGVKDITVFLKRSPQVLGYSVDGNIKPTIRFLVELGYTQAEVITIINRFPQILGLSIDGNIKPKWDYYVTLGLPKSYLVSFPQYFGYSLETRIKPRFEAVLKLGACWSPSRILSSSSKKFENLLDSYVEDSQIISQEAI